LIGTVLVLGSCALIGGIMYVLLTPKDSRNSAFEDGVIVEDETLGIIKGLETSEGIGIFMGIPFSEPPTGAYRWRRPREKSTPLHNEDQGYYDATYARPGCIQNCTLPSPDYVCPAEMSEDCLHLNVYVPSRMLIPNEQGGLVIKPEEKLPVMFWIYGGAFEGGGSNVILYDGRYLAESGDVIVVTVNYRVGPLGFLYQDNGKEDAALGNFGIWDQIESLKWVQKHITKFGGDKDQVTMFGQSAGGQSTMIHLISDYSEPLFHQAIVHSGPFGINFRNTQEAQSLYDTFVQAMDTDCQPNDLDCLRNVPADVITYTEVTIDTISLVNPESITQVFEPWSPTVEGDLIKDDLYTMFIEGKDQSKPMIFGFTKDEGMLFVNEIFLEPISKQTLQAILALQFGDNGTAVLDHLGYDCRGPDCDYRYPMSDATTQWAFTCQSRFVFTESRKTNRNLWWYDFRQVWSFPQFWEPYTACSTLSCHSEELPYVFGLEPLAPGEIQFTDYERILSSKMITYWSNFAKSGNPNLPNNMDIVNWPPLFENPESDDIARQMLIFEQNDIQMKLNDLNGICDFWDNIAGFYRDDSIKLPGGLENIIQAVRQESDIEAV